MKRTAMVLVAACLALAGCGEVLQSTHEPKFDPKAAEAAAKVKASEAATKTTHGNQEAANK